MRTAVLLINVGTPDSPKTGAVRRFLSAFLNDGRVISMPALPRALLVNAVIVPFRAPKSARLYQQLWTKDGSPLLHHSNKLATHLQAKLPSGYDVFVAMRYGNPALAAAMAEIQRAKYGRLIVVPLYPQYASSTTGTTAARVMQILQKWPSIPELHILSQFYDHQLFTSAWAHNIGKHSLADYDHVLFSFHGLPLKQVYAAHSHQSCDTYNCIGQVNLRNSYCYQASCYATARNIAQAAGIESAHYSVCFQSRFARKWLSPFTDEVLKQKAAEGKTRILVVSPAFVADCLETKVEIEHEYDQVFKQAGGQKLQLVESLNSSEQWADCLRALIAGSTDRPARNTPT